MSLTEILDTFRVDATDSGPFDTQVHVQALSDGGYVYAWRERDVDGYNERDRIHIRKFDADGNPVGSEFEIPGAVHEPGPHGSGSGHWYPTIAPLADGGFAVEYNDLGMGTDYTNGGHYFNAWTWVATFNSAGVLVSQTAPLGLPVQGSPNSFTNWSSAIAGDGWGGYHSAVVQLVSYPEGPSGNRILLNGTEVLRHQGLLSSATEGYSINAGVIDVADHVDGAIAVYGRNYYTGSTERSDLWAVTSTGFQFRINETVEGNQNIGPEGDYLAQLSDGNYVLVWKDTNSTTDEGTDPGWGVHARIFRGDGTFVTGDIVLSATPGGDETAPAVAAMSGGRWIAVWEDDGGIVAQVFSATGARLGDQVATGIPASGDSITLTVLTDDRIVFAFHDGGSTTSSEIWRFPDVFGTDGPDTLYGSDGDDLIYGGAGDDTLYGSGGDRLYGEAGDDTLVLTGMISGGTYDGGTGTDTLELRVTTATPFGAYVWASAYAFFDATIVGVEQLRFDSDMTTGIAAQMLLDQLSGSGISTLIGGDGHDTMVLIAAAPSGGTFTMPSLNLVNWVSAADPVTQAGDVLMLIASGTGPFTLNGREGLGSVQALIGADGNDVLNGTSGKDILDGLGGANTLHGNDGDDVLVIVNAIDAGGHVTVYTGAGSVYDGGSGFDTLWVGGPVNFQGSLAGIEAIFLQAAYSSGAPLGAGSQPATNLALSGSVLAQLPISLALSGTGTVVITLAPGETYNASAWTAAPGSAIAIQVNGTSVGDALTGGLLDETLAGLVGDDTLAGGAGNDTLDGGTGVDVLNGGVGDDLYYVDVAGDQVIENAGEGVDEVRTGLASYVLGANVENLTGTSAAGQTLIGNGLANVITGGAGGDVINGDAGDDTMRGGAGHDYYYVFQAGDTVVENAGEGTDTVLAYVSHTLGANVENLRLLAAGLTGTGNNLANTIYGSSGDDTIIALGGADRIDAGAGNDTVDGGADADVIFGGAGNDTITGGAGLDYMVGQDGDDVYYADEAGDTVIEQPGGGTDTVYASSATHQLRPNIEFLIGTLASGQTLIGSSGAETIRGNAGNDVINGLAGNDAMEGGAGDDFYYVAQAGDTVLELAGEGTDTVLAYVNVTLGDNVENLRLLVGSLTGTGNALGNTMIGSAATDTLFGMGGADQINGGAGNDTIDAGEGNDFVWGGAGFDTIGGGDGNDVLRGEGDNDTLTGGAGADTLYGGAGNDVIRGGLDKDTLYGEAGADRFVFGEGETSAARPSADIVAGFSSAEGDKLDLRLIDANTTGTAPGDQAFAFIGNAAFGNVAGQLRYENSGGATWIEGDTNGDAIADFTIQLAGTLTPVATDFLL